MDGNGLQRDLGGIEARLDSHDDRFDKLEEQIEKGFDSVNASIAALTASENKRKGERATWGKILAGATAVAGIWEAAKAYIGHHT